MWNCVRRVVVAAVSASLLGAAALTLVMILTRVRGDSWGIYADAPKMMVQQGALRGFHSVTRKGRNISSFLSVPYAAPPIGELRFKAPQPPNPWLGTRDATEDAPMCLQPSPSGVLGQEDCLYLNVHTPKLPDKLSPLLPVMVWIHGGGFFRGTGNNKFFQPTYLLDHNVVLVTLNYRLGILGFLSAGDEVLPGNYGLKDQVAALIWVRENIKKFGGNSNCVTIFGGSAGGASVHYHMLSPISQGLFHRAVSQSGSALGPYALASKETALSQTMKVASLLGCPTVPTTELVACLRDKNATAITDTLSEFQMWGGIPTIAFTPVVEHSGSNRFLPDTPLNILRANKSAAVPWLTGVNAQDGCIIAESIFADPTRVIELDKNFNKLALETMYLRRQENASNVAETIHKFYFGDNHIDNEAVSEVTNMYTDSYFIYPLNWSLQAATGNRKVYVYYFTYVGTASNSILYGDTEHNYGSCHGDELLYLFPFDGILPNFTQNEQDQRMVDILTALWTNFARTGKPTDQVSNLVPVAWDTVTQQAGNYLEIGVHLYRRTSLLPLPVRLWHSVFQWAYNIN